MEYQEERLMNSEDLELEMANYINEMAQMLLAPKRTTGEAGSRQETGDSRQGIGDTGQKTGDRRQGTRDRSRAYYRKA